MSKQLQKSGLRNKSGLRGVGKNLLFQTPCTERLTKSTRLPQSALHDANHPQCNHPHSRCNPYPGGIALTGKTTRHQPRPSTAPHLVTCSCLPPRDFQARGAPQLAQAKKPHWRTFSGHQTTGMNSIGDAHWSAWCGNLF